MWLLTPIGFYSIVEKPWDREPRTLTVRARVRGDLDALRDHYLPALGPTTEDPRADYRFRAQVARDDLAAALARIVADLDYDNFKNAVAKRQGKDRAHVYGAVWQALYRLQE